MIIEAFIYRFPDTPQVLCFDTAFHHDMPRVAKILAIPRRYEAKGVRRLGFHGISYSFLMRELVRMAGKDAFPSESSLPIWVVEPVWRQWRMVKALIPAWGLHQVRV